MSYCRWSSDNWRCELYCYSDVSGGFTTHVAGNKVVGDIPPEPPLELAGTDGPEWERQHNAVMDFLNTAERRPIGLAYDGQSFNDPTLEAFRDRLLMLRAAGYRFPDYVLAEVAEEMLEVANAAPPNG